MGVIASVRGTIERRVLVSYRIDPEVAARLLPPPLAPELVGGYAVGGVCLIRLTGVQPSGVPWAPALSAESVAHRLAATWLDEAGPGQRQGVFVIQRHTDSRLLGALSGRLFPGVLEPALVDASDSDSDLRFRATTRNGAPLVDLAASPCDALPTDSVFPGVDEASEFHRHGCVGLSRARRGTQLEAARLTTSSWDVTPLQITHLDVPFFSEPDRFPPGTVAFDHALLMRDIDHRWIAESPVPIAEAA